MYIGNANSDDVRGVQHAAAEALFYLGEYKYRDFRAIEFPRYRGGRTLARVNRWAQGEFMQWVRRKLAALSSSLPYDEMFAERRA